MKYSFPAFENGFVRAAAATPALHVADCAYNAQQIIDAMSVYAAQGVQLVCFPEFCLTGYTCSDLFLQQTLLKGAEDGLAAILEASRGLNLVALVGLPVAHDGKLYNCAAVLCNGELLGLVPKQHLPNYGEFYEKRHFVPGMAEPECIEFAGQETLIGTRLLFSCKQLKSFVLGVEVCEDLWSPMPPSCALALAGATVIANLSASDETIGKAAYRRQLISGQSARLLCAYLYDDAGHGESTTDMTFAGHNLIAENGTLLAETAPFEGGTAMTELDLDRMVQERRRNTTFMPETAGYTRVEFELPPVELALTRQVSPTPFVPQDTAARASFAEINITNTVNSHFADIGQDPQTYDVTFENCQARVRTLELMDYANKNGGFVIGTGDLSELALGWATYNGDHMSMYGVNALMNCTIFICTTCCASALDLPKFTTWPAPPLQASTSRKYCWPG